MFDNVLFTVIFAVLVTFAIVQIGNIVYRRRLANPGEKLQDNFFEAWDKVRPVLTELFIDVVEFYDVTQGTYEDAETFAVDWILFKINNMDALYPEEKALFTRERIIKLVRPRLQEWYNQKI